MLAHVILQTLLVLLLARSSLQGVDLHRKINNADHRTSEIATLADNQAWAGILAPCLDQQPKILRTHRQNSL
ncbi:hypothetical protein GJAV_G00274900 [Gymnothorax javanicus]|nr:hypothetical protein GJAV_G00274900 [Gymnothorax javanicus]